MKKHAFIIQVHKEPELFGRIVKILSKDNHYFFINVDAKSSNYDDFQKVVTGIRNVNFLNPRHSVTHGGFSQIECTLRLLRMVKDILPEYDFVHSLSGQDYPLRSNELFDDFFDKTSSGFMLFDSETLVEKWRNNKYSNRVNRWYANEYCSNRYVYKCHKIRTKFLNIFFRRTDIQEIRGGWSWFTWTPSIVDFVFNYLEKNPSYLKRFKYTNCGDELIFQTILFPEAHRLNLEMYRPYRYVSWKPKGRKTDVGNNFPYILNEEDFEDVYNSEAFFCRKVDLPVSSELLDLIDMKRECPFDINKALPISNSE